MYKKLYSTYFVLFLFISAFIATNTLPTSAQSTVIASDDFESYSTGNLNGGNGGTGWGGSWSVNNSQQVVASGLSYSITDGATIDGGTNAFRITSNNDQLFQRQISGGVSETFFVRYLLQWETGTIDTNDFVATGIRSSSGSYNTAGVFGLKTNEGSSDEDFFIRPSSSSSNNFYSSTQLTEGDTYLVVVRYSKGAGNFNQMDLWVNPAQGDEASPDATASNDWGVNTANFFGARVVNISSETVLIDEVIISTEWDDVVPPAPEVEFSAGTGSDNEATTDVPQLILNFDGTLASAETIDVTVTGGTATTADYTNTVSVTIPAGSGDGDLIDINFAVTDDSDVEGDETVEFTLSNPSGDMAVGAQDTFTYTITEDDTATVAFDTTNTTTPAEATAGIQSFDVSLTINGTTATAGTLQNGDVTADVELQATGTATDGTDFATFTTVNLTFTAGSGDSTESIDVTITDDSEIEGDETIDFSLTNVSANASTGTDAHTVTITDDDTAVFEFVTANSTTASENIAGTHTVDVILTLTGTTATPASLKTDATINVVDSTTGSATALDYTYTDTLLTFSIAETQSVDVTILDDADTDPNETVIIGLSTPSTNASIGTVLLHTVTIDDNEGGGGGGGDDDDTSPQSAVVDSDSSSSNGNNTRSESQFADVLLSKRSLEGFIINGEFTIQIFVNNNRDIVLDNAIVNTTFPSGVEITGASTTLGTTNVETTTLMRPQNRRALNKNRNDVLQAVTQNTVVTSLGTLQPGQRAVITISGRITGAFRGASVDTTSTIGFNGLANVQSANLRLPIVNALPLTGETPIWRTPLMLLLGLITVTGVGVSGWVIKRRYM